MIALSFSRLKDVECPFRFNALYIAKTYKEPESERMRVGGAVAKILATYRNHCISNKIQNDVGLLGDIKARVQADLREKVVPLLDRFSRSEFVSVPIDAKWYQVEDRFAFNDNLLPIHGNDAWFDKSVAFRAVVDFAFFDPKEGILDITDDKTGWGDSDELELKIYAYLLKTAWMSSGDLTHGLRLKKIRARFNNIATGTVNEMELEPQETNSMRELILGKIKEVNAWTEYPARVCSCCRFCTVPDCPVRAESEKALVAADGSPVTEIPLKIFWQHEAEKALQFIDFADGIIGQVRDALKAWVDKNGPVVVGGRIAGYSDRESWQPKDLAAFCKALISWGAPPEMIWQNLSLTKSATEKVIKKAKLEKQMPFIESMVEKKVSRTFGIKNDHAV